MTSPAFVAPASEWAGVDQLTANHDLAIYLFVNVLKASGFLSFVDLIRLLGSTWAASIMILFSGFLCSLRLSASSAPCLSCSYGEATDVLVANEGVIVDHLVALREVFWSATHEFLPPLYLSPNQGLIAWGESGQKKPHLAFH